MRGITSNYISIEENFDLSLDHLSIILTLSDTSIIKKQALSLINKKTDWIAFKKELEPRIKLNTSLKIINSSKFEIK